MQFQTPQFIETEDKIVGPFTLKQFFYVAGAALFDFFLFFQMDNIPLLWFMIASPVMAGAIALALVKVNGRPMSAFLQSVFFFFWSPKTYYFNPVIAVAAPSAPTHGRLGGIKNLLTDLKTSKEAIPKRESPLTSSFGLVPEKEKQERYEVLRKVTGEQEAVRRIDYR